MAVVETLLDSGFSIGFTAYVALGVKIYTLEGTKTIKFIGVEMFAYWGREILSRILLMHEVHEPTK